MLINVRGKEASGILWLEQNIFSNETSQILILLPCLVWTKQINRTFSPLLQERRNSWSNGSIMVPGLLCRLILRNLVLVFCLQYIQ